jgi:hypothetical protein
MNTSIKKSYIAALAILALALAPIMITGSGGDRGTILSVHDELTTAKFKAVLGLPPGQAEGGRFAVVKIEHGAYGDASFALVYVPPQFNVHDDSVVQLNASGVSVLAHPGSATVAKVIDDASVSRMTQLAEKSRQIWRGLSFGA